MRWRLSAKDCSMARAISYWPFRCSKAREERESTPPGEKNSCRVGSLRAAARAASSRDSSSITSAPVLRANLCAMGGKDDTRAAFHDSGRFVFCSTEGRRTNARGAFDSGRSATFVEDDGSWLVMALFQYFGGWLCRDCSITEWTLRMGQGWEMVCGCCWPGWWMSKAGRGSKPPRDASSSSWVQAGSQSQ